MSVILALIGLAVTGLNAWLALSMRAHRNETQRSFAELRLEFTSKLDEAVMTIRRDSNGSYMRANEVREIVKRLEGESQNHEKRIDRLEQVR
jgi:hypothetical protein